MAQVDNAKILEKIDPSLLFLFELALEDEEARQVPAQRSQKVSLPVLVEVDEELLEGDLITQKEGGPETWDSSDCHFLGRAGSFVSYLATYDGCKCLAAHRAVIEVTGGHRSTGPATADSCEQVGVWRAHASSGEKGDQALIVIIDDDIDVVHPAFFGARRTLLGTRRTLQSRIIGVYNRRGDGASPPQYVETYNAADIRDFITGARAVPPALAQGNGHGTAVASIAAGVPAGQFAGGVAQEARIAVILALRDSQGGWDAGIAEMLRYITSLAERARLPVVVNISQGLTLGAHDGTSSVERALAQWTGNGLAEGRAVVVSAGNTRDWRGHAQVHVPSSGTQLAWEVRSPLRQLKLQLWFDPRDHFRFRLYAPNAAGNPAIIDPAVNQSVGPDEFVPGGDRYMLRYEQLNRLNRAANLEITLRAAPYAVELQQGAWTLEIEAAEVSAGHIDAWIEQDLRPDRPYFSTPTHVVTETTLTIPGTHPSIISVAAVPNGRSPATSVAPFSGQGSTWHLSPGHHHKPDISAPGVNIRAAASSASNARLGGYTHQPAKLQTGTSFSAPHVTGAIALMFSKREKARGTSGWHQLTTAEIVRLLRTTGVSPAGPGSWDPDMGYGVLDADALLQLV